MRWMGMEIPWWVPIMVRDEDMKKDTTATPRDTEKYLLVYGTGKWEGI